MYTFVCVCPSLAPCLGGACACVVVVRFPSEGTLQVDRRLLNYASTDLYKRSAQHLQEDAGRDDAWEASPTWFDHHDLVKAWGQLELEQIGYLDQR